LLLLGVVYNMRPIGWYLTILMKCTCNIHIDLLSIDLLLLISTCSFDKHRLYFYSIFFYRVFASQTCTRRVFFMVQWPVDSG
jgi:hypothetical protein